LLIAGFPSDVFGTNCYVVAPGPGEQCLVIDPGLNVVDQLDALLDEHRLRPAAVLLTHGHLDHTFSVTPVCGARGISAYIHPDDNEMLADPAKGLSRDVTELFGGRFTWTEPDDVKPLAEGTVLDLAGVQLTVDHAPGHTRGSVLFRTVSDPVEGPEPICFSGDVLFAGSIGRTDLPGGDLDAMQASLRDKILTLDDETVVLPGHGPTTTIGQERATNPFLRELARTQ
jgi:hydroxyacylglutathione hydrolase